MIFRLVAAASIFLIVVPSAQAQGNVNRGAKAFRQCAACHSLDPGYHLTGPSLFGVIGRPAGKAKNFKRYSEALKVAEFSWTQIALDQWLENPAKLVPGTSMRIRPITDASMRQDIIAFLESRQEAKSENKGKSRMPDLKNMPPGQQVTSLQYCPDAYQVSVASGNTFTFWEYNLRFKEIGRASCRERV